MVKDERAHKIGQESVVPAVAKYLDNDATLIDCKILVHLHTLIVKHVNLFIHPIIYVIAIVSAHLSIMIQVIDVAWGFRAETKYINT